MHIPQIGVVALVDSFLFIFALIRELLVTC